MAGRVSSDGSRLTKPGHAIDPEAALDVRQPESVYVSRGGLKLVHALDQFAIAVRDCIAIDVGASTGGFTDVLLRRGARRVYAVDVGYGQLAWALRQDERVVVMERTNIRHLAQLPLAPTLAVIDVSFISLGKVVPALNHLLAATSQIVALVKPQFEAGRGQVGKGGVVRDRAVHATVLEQVTTMAVAEGWQVGGIGVSPIRGPAGNREFLLWLGRGLPVSQCAIEQEIALLVIQPDSPLVESE